jgi:putative PEP-CTERM system histidine kinase
MLIERDLSGAFVSGGEWNWHAPTAIDDVQGMQGFWDGLVAGGRIVELDGIRIGWADAESTAAMPKWIVDEPDAWVGVPLVSKDKAVGFVLVAAPDYRRALDWEDFDLLRTAGRQAASSLAEAQGQRALADAQRFEEFNRRFAFILHDIKNLVSQLSLVARNAERHAGNAEFRADMIATLKSSIGKMNDLLARLSPQASPRANRVQPKLLRDLLAEAVAVRRSSHDVQLLGDCGEWAVSDSEALSQAIGHLLQNAIEASPQRGAVTVRAGRTDHEVSITISDKGAGMDSDFVRDRLFQPFASTKAGGFGIGAFEARSLVTAMGGRITVESRPGAGTQFIIHLPASEMPAEEQRKIA